MIRRKPEAVILAHTMDRSRKELYVEGKRDRLFFSWLLKGQLPRATTIREIDFVDLPAEVLGGQKGRLFEFARWIGAMEVRIRMFADADYDRLLQRAVPDRVWLTDYRDLEGYVLHEKCVDKMVRLGLGTERFTAPYLLALVRRHGRKLGLLRLMSEMDSLNLPFQTTDLKRHIETGAHACELNFDSYLRALLQNAKINLTQLVGMKDRLAEVTENHSNVPDSQMIHGKDALCILEVALSDYELSPGDAGRFLWTSFESSFVEKESTLDTVVAFLRSE
jgi:hypothetical protein